MCDHAPTLIKALFGALLLTACALYLQQARSDDLLTLEYPGDIQDAVAINTAMDAISTRVMACAEERGGALDDCNCRNACDCPFKPEWQQLDQAFRNAVAKHPEWRDKILFFQVADNPAGYNIVMPSLERTLTSACKVAP